MNPSIYPLAIAGIIMVLMAGEDFKSKGIIKWRSHIYEIGLIICIALNFIFDWEFALILAIVGLVIYLAAIPGIEKLVRERYSYKFYELDKEIFITTMIGWPFISLFSFLGNQLGNIFYALIKRHLGWSKEMPQLVVYGIIWFLISMAITVLYIH